jgi:hypothetical protein
MSVQDILKRGLPGLRTMFTVPVMASVPTAEGWRLAVLTCKLCKRIRL